MAVFVKPIQYSSGVDSCTGLCPTTLALWKSSNTSVTGRKAKQRGDNATDLTCNYESLNIVLDVWEFCDPPTARCGHTFFALHGDLKWPLFPVRLDKVLFFVPSFEGNRPSPLTGYLAGQVTVGGSTWSRF